MPTGALGGEKRNLLQASCRCHPAPFCRIFYGLLLMVQLRLEYVQNPVEGWYLSIEMHSAIALLGKFISKFKYIDYIMVIKWVYNCYLT